MKYKLNKDIATLGMNGEVVDIEVQTCFTRDEDGNKSTTMSGPEFNLLVHTGMIEEYTEPVKYSMSNTPSRGTKYYQVCFDGPFGLTWTGRTYDYLQIQLGNCYATMEEAQQAYLAFKSLVPKSKS